MEVRSTNHVISGSFFFYKGSMLQVPMNWLQSHDLIVYETGSQSDCVSMYLIYTTANSIQDYATPLPNLNKLDNGLWSTEFSESLSSTVADFSPPPSLKPFDFNTNDIPDCLVCLTLCCTSLSRGQRS